MKKFLVLVAIALVSAYVLFQIVKVKMAYSGLDNVSDEYTIGSDNADLTVVEFLSYECRYCREVHPTIMKAVKEDGRVRYIPRPLLSNSTEASFVVYAAGQQGKFVEMHNALIENFRTISDQVLEDLAQETDTDVEQLKIGIGSDAVQEAVMENTRLFTKIEGTATPTFIIGEKLFYVPEGRMPTVADFKAMFDEARGLQ